MDDHDDDGVVILEGDYSSTFCKQGDDHNLKHTLAVLSGSPVPMHQIRSCPPPPPPALPPPPPFTGIQQPLHLQTSFPPRSRPPPPPPPPPPTPPAHMHIDSTFRPDVEVDIPNEFIRAQYSDQPIHCLESQVVRIAPFRRNVLLTRHQATAAEYKEYEWILRYGSTELWYRKPTKAFLSMKNADPNHCVPELLPVVQARPVSLETPTVWASAPMTTPPDNNVYYCAASHAEIFSYTGICGNCTHEQKEAMENTSLAYYLILSSCQGREPFVQEAHFNGHKIYSMIRCGSREAAVAEAFYASGVNGWNVAFSCVMRLDEDFEERSGKAKVVNDLAQLAQIDEDKEKIRVFY